MRSTADRDVGRYKCVLDMLIGGDDSIEDAAHKGRRYIAQGKHDG